MFRVLRCVHIELPCFQQQQQQQQSTFNSHTNIIYQSDRRLISKRSMWQTSFVGLNRHSHSLPLPSRNSTNSTYN